jgi:hypothetical protein
LREVSMDTGQPDEPIQSLNSQPLGDNLHIDENGIPGTQKPEPPGVSDPTAPPPVPPPIPFDFGNPPPPNS